MSIQAVAWVLEQSQARGFARLVLIALANHADEDGICWPSQRRIASEAGISLGSVQPQIGKLETLGELETVEPGGPRRSARYRLPFADLRSGGEHKSVQELNAARGPGLNAASSPGVNRIIKNHQEPSEISRAHAEAVIAEARETLEAARQRDAIPYAEDFAAFYAEYPRKVDRRQALLKYQARRREGVAADRLLDAAVHYARSVRGSDPKFVKHAATFLAPDGPWTEWEHGPPNQRGGRADPNVDNPGWAERHPELAR